MPGIAPPLPPPPQAQGPGNAECQAAVQLHNVIKGLRKHIPKLRRLLGQVRAGLQFDSDVVKIIIDLVDNASGGMPWPVGLAIQAALLLARNMVQFLENDTAGESLTSTIEDLQQKLQRLEGLAVQDADRDKVNEIIVKLLIATAVVNDIVAGPSRRTGCLRAFVCAQCNAKDLSDVKEDLEKCLESIRDIVIFITAYGIERPSTMAPELPSHLFGMDEPVLKVMGFLRNSGERTCVVGLHGQGGIGKTTLMWAVESKLKSHVQDDSGSRTTHRIASVEVGENPSSLKDLQKSLFSQLSGGSNEIFSSEGQGRAVLKNLMKKLKEEGEKICLFLDNVGKLEHLKELLPQHDLADALPHGSYLIISSRSAQVSAWLAGMCFTTNQGKDRGYLQYELPLLPKQDAEDLFLRNASRDKEENPLQRNDPLVQAIVPRCNGLPLALTMYGSYFKDKERRKPNVWKKVLVHLERAEDLLHAEHRMFEKLGASVDFQDKRLQDAFLDTALLSRFVSSVDSKDANFGSTKRARELVIEEDDLNDLVDQSLVIRGKRPWQVKIHDLLHNVAKKNGKRQKRMVRDRGCKPR